jgi:hypothetical protein
MERTEGAIKSLYHRTLITLRDDIEMQRMKHVQSPSDRKKCRKFKG